MSDAYVLDSWALLALLQQEEPAASRVRGLLTMGEQQEASLLLSIVNLGEVFYRVGKRRGERQAEAVLAAIGSLALSVIPASEEAVFAAARLKIRYPISYADAFAAALAMEAQAILVSGDPDFDQLAGLLKLEKLARST